MITIDTSLPALLLYAGYASLIVSWTARSKVFVIAFGLLAIACGLGAVFTLVPA